MYFLYIRGVDRGSITEPFCFRVSKAIRIGSKHVIYIANGLQRVLKMNCGHWLQDEQQNESLSEVFIIAQVSHMHHYLSIYVHGQSWFSTKHEADVEPRQPRL